MQCLGKIIGAVFAITIGADFWGIILCLIIGHIFDNTHTCKVTWFTDNSYNQQTLFISTTFEVMGHLTKSKGRVTETDILVACIFMDRMNLHGKLRIAAQNAFRIGKAANYPLRKKLRQFRSIYFGRFDLIRMFLEMQIQAAFSDGFLHPNELDMLHILAEELDISCDQFNQFLRSIQDGVQFGNQYQQQQSSSGWKQTKHGLTLEDAWNILGVRSTDDAKTIKRAYRRLMSEYHPDKLIAKGLPLEMMVKAKKKAQEIQKAYSLIKEQKKFK